MRQLFLLLVFACLHLAPAYGSVSFEATRAGAVQTNPPGVSLTLSVAGGRTVFHRGEVLPLTAAFGASVPGRYDLNTDPGSRDLQWNSDVFHCDAPGAADPLRVYYDREFGMSYSGPGPRFEPLTGKPVTIGYTLNEWLRFDVPGHYRVYLTSGRVVNAAKRHEGLLFQGRSVTSNAVEFTVLPDDPAWDAQTLQSALPLFNADGSDYRTQEARTAAVRTVRFLGTLDAGRAMLTRYESFSEYESLNSAAYYQTRLGLFGFPDLAFVIAEMQRRLADPRFPVFSFFLYDLAQVQFLAAYTQTVPPYVPNNPARDKERQDLLRQRMKAMADFSDQDRLALVAAAPAKLGRAKALSAFTLLQNGYRNRHTPAQRELARSLVLVFDDLTPDEQYSLLDESGYWPDIRGPQMLPLLRRLCAAPQQDHSMALRHLVELSPAEGRRLLLAEIQSLTPRVDLPTLCSLPDRTLPGLDTTLAVNLENSLQQKQGDSSVEARLVERYATAAIVPRVKAGYCYVGCDVEADLLAYFLRTDPAYGAAQLKHALARRKDVGCYRYVLGAVAALHYGPEVERLAVLHLHDPDPQTAADAAKTLGAYGSPAAEAPLWARMREWHRQWAGKAAQIEPTDNPASETWELEYALTQALATAPDWALTAPQLQALKALCVTSGGRQNIESLMQDWSTPVGIAYDEGNLWRVAQYGQMVSLAALETKLAQFPAGTRFRLSSSTVPDGTSAAQVRKQLQTFLARHQMFLEAEPLEHS